MTNFISDAAVGVAIRSLAYIAIMVWLLIVWSYMADWVRTLKPITYVFSTWVEGVSRQWTRLKQAIHISMWGLDLHVANRHAGSECKRRR